MSILNIIGQILSALTELQAGQPVTIKAGPENLALGTFGNFSVNETVTIQKVA